MMMSFLWLLLFDPLAKVCMLNNTDLLLWLCNISCVNILKYSFIFWIWVLNHWGSNFFVREFWNCFDDHYVCHNKRKCRERQMIISNISDVDHRWQCTCYNRCSLVVKISQMINQNTDYSYHDFLESFLWLLPELSEL